MIRIFYHSLLPGLLSSSLSILASLIVVAAVMYAMYKLYYIFRTESTRPDFTDIESQVPIELQENERIVYTNHSQVSPTVLLIAQILGVCFIFLIVTALLGYILLVFARKLSKQPTYVFTDKRLYVVEFNGNRTTYQYEELSQLQVGQQLYERVFQQGHIEFSIGENGLKRIVGVHNYRSVAEQINQQVSSS